LNCISKRAARKAIGTRIKVDKVVGVLDVTQKITEGIIMTIRIGSKVDTIVAYIVDGIPGNIVIGSLFFLMFLCKHSEGYRKMLEEFKGHVNVHRMMCVGTGLHGVVIP